jgi:hypothetical protein
MELAQSVWGPGVRSTLLGTRATGALRGLLKLDVPFRTLDEHRDGERTFLSLVGGDPLMERVPLLFVVGPDGS